MVFTDTKSEDDVILSNDWNDFVDFTESISSNAYGASSNYAGHSSNDDIHFPSSSITPWLDGVYQQSGSTGFDSSWSGASEFYAVSSLVNTLDLWYDNSSQKYSKAYASAQIASYGDGGISAWYDLSAGTGVTPFGGSVSISGTQAETISILGYLTISSQAKQAYDFSSASDLFNHELYATSSNIYNRTWIDALSGSIDTRIDAIEADTFNHDLYITSSNSITRFADSSNYSTHKEDSTIHFTKASIDDDYAGSSNVNWTKITAISSGFDGRLDTLEGYDEFNHELYCTSANIIANYVESGGTKWTDLTDGGETDLHTHAGSTDVAWSGASEFYVVSSMVNTLDTWYDASAQKLSASGALAHNKVTLAGQDYLTISDQEITAGKLDMEDTNLTDGLGITFATNDISVTDYAASAQLKTKIDAKQDTLTEDSVTQAMLKSGSEYWGAYLSGQNVNQSVLTGAAPTFTADNFSDGGSNAIITTTQETNFTSAYTWYTESSQKLSDISGSLSTKIDALDALTGDTVSSNFFLKTSGQSIWDWYSTSGVNLYSISTNLNTKIDSKIDVTTVSSNFLTATSGVALFGFSSNAKELYLHSGVTLNYISANKGWFSNQVMAYSFKNPLNESTYISFETNNIHFDNDGVRTISIEPNAPSGHILIGYDLMSPHYVRTDFYDGGSNEMLTILPGKGGVSNQGTVGIYNNNPIYRLQVQGAISAQTYSGNIVRATNYISSQGGIYANFISANATNLSASDTSWSGASEFYAVSSMVNTLDAWFDASAQKLSDISGSLATKIGAVSDTPSTWGIITAGTGIESTGEIGVSGAGATLSITQSEILTTVSSNAKSAYDWFVASSQSLSTFYASGDEYSTNYDWYNTNNSQLDNLLASGSKYSNIYQSGNEYSDAYSWFTNSSQKLSNWATSSDSYLHNGEDDTMAGVLTSNGFTTTAGISSNVISSQSMHGIAPMIYSIANIRISANQNINLAKFVCPATKSAYIYQAYACASGSQIGVSGLSIEMLAGSSFPLDGGDTVYKTSSQILQQGNPLGQSTAGQYIEVRFMYSGTQSDLTGIKYGTAMMQVGVY